MNESAKTAAYALGTLFLVLIALVTQGRVARNPKAFDDTGETLLIANADGSPILTDPDQPKALEVTEFDNQKGTYKSFRVEYKNGRWRIPSHHNYPADAEQRLAKTAGALIGLKRDAIAGYSKDSHEEFGVVDPLAHGENEKGIGTRIKLFDDKDTLLADLIFGKKVTDKPDQRYVRIPESDRVYITESKDVDLSIRLTDWINTSLLEVSSGDLASVKIEDYNARVELDREAGGLVLRKDDRGIIELDNDKDWLVKNLTEKEETNGDKARDLAFNLADLKIVGIRPKPPGLSPDLNFAEGQDMAEVMLNRGFIPIRRDVAARGGALTVETKEGVTYRLLFGGPIFGTGDEVTAGSDKEKVVDAAPNKPAPKAEGDKKAADVQENRFVLISVGFNEKRFPPIPDLPPAKEEPAPPPAKDDAEKKKQEEAKRLADNKRKQEEADHQRKVEERDKKIADAKKKAGELADRFANWYYLIDEKQYKQIDLGRADLVKAKVQPKPEDKPDMKPSPFELPPIKPAAPTEVEAKPAVKTPAKAEPKLDPKPTTKVEPKTEPKPTTKVEPKVEPKAEAKPAPKAEMKLDPKVPAKTEEKAPAKADSKPETKVHPKPDLNLEAKPAPKSAAKPDPNPTPMPDVKPKTEPKPPAKPQTQPTTKKELLKPAAPMPDPKPNPTKEPPKK